MSETDNIELRSEKVRNIIGQIPPGIIRSGISIIFIVTVILLAGSYFFKYSYTIKSEIVFKKENDKIIGRIKVAANEIVKVKSGQDVIVNFDNIPKMNNDYLITKIDFISKHIQITEKGAFNVVYIEAIDSLITNNGKLIIFTELLTGNSKIITDEISFFERIIQPIKSLLMKNKSW